MQIICPHCTTSYAIDPAKFAEGRKVRCARCQQVWTAFAEPMPVMAMPHDDRPDPRHDDSDNQASDSQASDNQTWGTSEPPHIESPPLSADWTDSQNDPVRDNVQDHWPAEAEHDRAGAPYSAAIARFRDIARNAASFRATRKLPFALPAINLNIACAAMGAMVFALVFWRSDVVRLMPQTAAFYKSIGLCVNLRGLAINDVKITVETVNAKPVLLIEGSILDISRKPVEIPRLRFIVRDANGADLYAWNAVLQQSVLNPGDKALFRTRLAAPPPEGREIAVRFFHKQDLAAGGT